MASAWVDRVAGGHNGEHVGGLGGGLAQLQARGWIGWRVGTTESTSVDGVAGWHNGEHVGG